MEGYYTLDVQAMQASAVGRHPFSHQQEAFQALDKEFRLPVTGYRGSLLVLPTAGGKTYTSVNWICRTILSKRIKVLWLAQSSYLLDQAAKTFMEEARAASGRGMINLRVVSSGNKHANAGSIQLTDDVLICTTQTAISAYNAKNLDGRGNPASTPFRKFVDGCTESALFVVVDEAHHTPAYGCRNLLLDMRNQLENLYLLGLTATPMHMDRRISGWLKNIYDRWICYEADKNILQANKILSVPKYIEKQTGFECEVDDALFDRLVYKHKDLPENIIEYLAENHSRNDFIVSDYVANRSEYGKTIIFADRWEQCEYIAGKLKERGVKADAVYSKTQGQSSISHHGQGRRDDATNRRIVQEFRDGHLEALVNIRMLTEGVDVPDVKTVMITRQTTSNILLTQMIGRALRGEKAGGGPHKDYANIVFFHDTWKRLLPWASTDGAIENEKPVTQGRPPLELVSIHLVHLAVSDIEYAGFEHAAYIEFIPVGFLACEYTVAITEQATEELISFAENVIVYEFNKAQYETMLNDPVFGKLEQYADEMVVDNTLLSIVHRLMDLYFDHEKDNFDGLLEGNIIKIIRHVAQNDQRPIFVDFHERNLYDLDRLAKEMEHDTYSQVNQKLRSIFEDEAVHWRILYKNFQTFKNAFSRSMERVLAEPEIQAVPPIEPDKTVDTVVPTQALTHGLTDKIKQKVKARDSYSCVCCGKKPVRGLEVDHIKPVSMEGTDELSNLQTLCKQCNQIKRGHEINFKVIGPTLSRPKTELALFPFQQYDRIEHVMARIVNLFYHGKAMFKLNYSSKSYGPYYLIWEIILYSDHDPAWLSSHSAALLKHVQTKLRAPHVIAISVKN